MFSFSYSAQQFNVILDTGSSDLWVASDDCQACPQNIAFFDSSKSSSFTSQNQQITISYGSGEVAGTVATDTVSMGGFTVSGQTFSEYYPHLSREGSVANIADFVLLFLSLLPLGL